MDRIQKIFVINLPHRTDRLESIKRELHRMGLLDKMEIVEGVIIDVGAFGTAGLAEARARCFERAQERGYEMIMVLEDDCKFLVDNQTFNNHIEDFLNTAPSDWNGLWFGSFFSLNEEQLATNLNWAKVTGFDQDTATLTHHSFYSKLIEMYRHCRDKYIETQDDIYTTDAWLRHNKTQVFVLKSKLCGQADCFSDRTFLDMRGGCETPL
jgi:GR25 family glycosyltransferase involved in LPS biosynthesis